MTEKQNKDWTGNSNSIYKTLGASNHTDKERQREDFYATESKAGELLLQIEKFSPNVWECAAGELHLSKVFEKAGYTVRSSDLIERVQGMEVFDFLSIENIEWDGSIVTNPPYSMALQFIYKALEIIPDGEKVAMFLKIQFLEGKERKSLFKNFPPKVVYVSSSRLLCAKNADFEGMRKGGGSAVCYAWYIWEKAYKGDTILKWIN